MWKVHEDLQPFLRAADRLVVDVLNWAWKHHSVGGDTELLKQHALAAQGRLGVVARATNLDQKMAELAVSPHLMAIRRDYFRITRDYRRFFDSGARLELNGVAREAAAPIFRWLYTNLLDSSTFWGVYAPRRPQGMDDKQAYRKEFRKGRLVCPFCDYKKVNVVATSEHVLRQVDFPVLTVFWLNLVVSCSDCNSGARGQKVIGAVPGEGSMNVPIFHPFFDQIADFIQIPFGEMYRPLEPIVTSGKASERIRARNFCKVYEIGKRYSDDMADAQGFAGDFLRSCRRQFELEAQTRGRTRAVLTDVVKREASMIRTEKMRDKGMADKVKFICDLLSHLEGQVSILAEEMGLP